MDLLLPEVRGGEEASGPASGVPVGADSRDLGKAEVTPILRDLRDHGYKVTHWECSQGVVRITIVIPWL